MSRQTWTILHSNQNMHTQSCIIKLYISLVRSQLLYCLQLWRPHLMKDILHFKQIQRRSTKHILNDYTSGYKDRLIKLKLFSLMYLFELQDILFAVKSVKTPTSITNCITFSSTNTRSSINNKLIHLRHLNNVFCHSYIFISYHCSGMLCLLLI